MKTPFIYIALPKTFLAEHSFKELWQPVKVFSRNSSKGTQRDEILNARPKTDLTLPGQYIPVYPISLKFRIIYNSWAPN